MAAFDGLTFSLTPNRGWSASINQAGYNPVSKNDNFNTPTISLGTGYANAAAGGADMLLSQIISIAASGTNTIDLTSFTDVMQRAAQAMVRVKYIEFWLQTLADNAVTPGTAASQITIGAASSNAFLMELGGTTPTKILKSGEFCLWGTRGAAGLTVDATHKNVLITNNDATLAAVVRATVCGGTT